MLNDQDVDMYVFAPIIYLSKDIKINPYYVFLHSKDGVSCPTMQPALTRRSFGDIRCPYFGLDFDAKMGAASLWFTGIMQTGTLTIKRGFRSTCKQEPILILKDISLQQAENLILARQIFMARYSMQPVKTKGLSR